MRMATNELKEVLAKDGRLEIPKEYVDVRPLKIKSHWITQIIKHKKGELLESTQTWYKEHKEIPEDEIEFNGERFKIKGMK